MLRRLRRIGQRIEGGDWIFQYSRMFEASFAGFIVGATFLNRGHFDLFYQLVALVVALQILAVRFAQQPLHERLRSDELDELPPLRVAGAEPMSPGWRRAGTAPVAAGGLVRRRWGR